VLAFINYRAEDTGGVALALAQSLREAFGDDAVFLDHRDIEPGEPWPDRLQGELDRASHLLVLIGPKWLTLQGAYGQRRLDDLDDWVRREIAAALAGGKVVIPLLVDAAGPLAPAALRALRDIEALATRQARSLVTRDWDGTFGALQQHLEREGFAARRTEADARPLPAPFRSTVPPRGRAPFVGREPLLAQLAEAFSAAEPTQLVVLHGPSGVGKSELAREYARTQQARYPGGTFVIDVRASGPPPELARIGRVVLGLVFSPDLSLEDQCIRALLTLGAARCLLIYDNAPRPERLDAWLPPAGQPCHLLVTSTWERWDPRWQTVPVPPLADSDARQLVERVAGTELARRHGESLVAVAAGLPVQLLPAAQVLLHDERRGHPSQRHLSLTAEAKDCFAPIWSTLDDEARLVLAAASYFHPDRIARGVLQGALAAAALGPSQVEAAVDRCADLFLLQGHEPLRMHQLWGLFVRERQAALASNGRLAPVREALLEALSEAAGEVSRQPASSEAARRLLSFTTDIQAWQEGGSIDAAELHHVAHALQEIGRFDEGLPWCERAVAEAERGDIHGRVDHESLSTSLHLVGFCRWNMGRFDEALEWFERAVTEGEEGDVHGRVDYDGLGRSVLQVGVCLASLGRFDEALPWLERAVSETKKGDVHGGVNHESVGRSMHLVGDCLASLDRFDEALPWFEGAVAEKEKGDIDRRVDHESLGRNLHQVGFCLSSLGRFDEALPWYERAVTAIEKGDVHGRINHETLGRSAHQVGSCLSTLSRFDEALPWYERAVTEADKGDVHGRVNHESLGKSVHLVGYCLSGLGRIDEALPWFERAVTETAKGDLHGRVDHDSLGTSVHLVGLCLASLGRSNEARPWFERAVAEKEKGDVHGRVNAESLALSREAAGLEP
jgi:tetratricopeptide (TPR) repeat protein